MKFILQDYKIRPDFQNELLMSKEYWDWRNIGKEETLKTNIDIITEDEINNINKIQYCPVGSIEFCINYFNELGIKETPINVPSSLMDEEYSGRKIKNIILDGKNNKEIIYEKFKDKYSKYFIKSNEVFKSENNGIYSIDNLDRLIGNYQISSIIDNIVSEWRVFVNNRSLVGLKNYSGDPFIVPNRERVEDFINKLNLSIPSYTLDIICCNNDKCFVLELHKFYSCGLYGFSDYNIYPFMLWRTFNSIINKL